MSYHFRGIFTIDLSLEFHERWNKSNLMTSWSLSFTNNGDQKIVNIDFEQSSDENTSD